LIDGIACRRGAGRYTRRPQAGLLTVLLLAAVHAAAAVEAEPAAGRTRPIDAVAIAPAERALATLEISNLMGRYAACVRGECRDGMEMLFALDELDVRITAAQRIEGPAALRRYLAVRRAGRPRLLLAPVIEIAGDGQTARGVWESPAVVGGSAWQRYGVDFIRTNAGWKIWHLRAASVLQRDGRWQAPRELQLPRPYYTFDSAEAY
jgi:hypothetical protein